MGEEAMMNNLLKTEFDAVCDRIIDADDTLLSESELEPSYELLLEFLVQHERDRDELVSYINEIIASYRNVNKSDAKFLPGLAIAYCMHVLRWHEIYAFADAENKNFYSKKMASGMTEILDAYSDDWDDKDFFRRFIGKHVVRPDSV
jgi:hypothetical protein